MRNKAAATLILVLLVLWSGPSEAQITLDGSMVPGTAGALTGPNFSVPHTFGQTRGANLFHSFGLFNVQTGQSVTFTGPNSTSNIFSRVTGGQPSNIDGTIRATIPNANLYLMNPAGMMFGPNASLDVLGSFHVTTADYLKFADGAKFHANLSRQSALTAAPVSAFGFIGQHSAPISIQRSLLKVADAQTLALVGGNIDIIGSGGRNIFGQGLTLWAPNGTVNVASVASSGEIPLNVSNMNLQSFTGLGQVILDSAGLDVSGNGGGIVNIHGGQLLVDKGSSIRANNLGDKDGSGIGVNIDITGDVTFRNRSLLTTITFPGTARAKDVKIFAGNLMITESDIISGFGSGGNITLNGRESVTIQGEGGAFTLNKSRGEGGSLLIQTKNLLVKGGAVFIANDGGGTPGTLKMSATESVILLDESASSFANQSLAGDIYISAPSVILDNFVVGAGTGPTTNSSTGNIFFAANDLILRNFAGVSANTANIFPAGNVTITAESLRVMGSSNLVTETSASGKGGSITIAATSGLVIDESSKVSTNTSSTGDAGNITITAKTSVLSNKSTISSETTGSGESGIIRLATTNSVTLSEAAKISVATGGSGAGGTIIIVGRNMNLIAKAAINSDTFGSGNGGTVEIRMTEAINLSDSQISSNNLGNIGNAGNISVETKSLGMTNGAVISSNTAGTGTGGTIAIAIDDTTTLSSRSTLSTNTSRSGSGGKIVLDSFRVVVYDNAAITATSSGTGRAGNVFIQGTDLTSTNGSITTASNSSDGGSIDLRMARLIDLKDSRITTSVGGGNGVGGDITIDPIFVILRNSQISANAFGGPGGKVTIVADNFLKSPNSTITASSALSTPGIINIQAPITDLSGSLAPLPEGIVQATSLLRQSCATRYSGGKLSSLSSPGRGGMPYEPGGLLASATSPSGFSAERFSSLGASNSGEASLTAAKPIYSIASRCDKFSS